MNDFLHFIIVKLQSGLAFALIPVALFAVGVLIAYFVFRARYKDTQKFPWMKVILILMLIGYIAVLAFLTILRSPSSGYRNINLHIFRAWREAWNQFALKNWLNVLLNVGMFIPLGMLFPLVFRKLRKWPFVLLIGLVASLIIEATQYVTGSGLCDVDDLLTNTLGTMLGFCIVMVLVSARERNLKWWKQSMAYAVFPIVAAIALSATFISYQMQEYGNLQDSATFTANTKNVEWELNCILDSGDAQAATYKTESFDKNACDAFGYAFFDKIGAVIEDVSYYDNETWFMNHRSPGHFLIVSYLDRSYKYSCADHVDDEWAEADEVTLGNLLEAYDIQVPSNAEFAYEGDGWHQFNMNKYFVGNIMIDGSIRCRYTAKGTLREIENNMVSHEFYKDEQVLSEQEAYEQLCRGKGSNGDALEHYVTEKANVSSCTLMYQTDTKGFSQPVYIFEVFADGAEYPIEVMIPALR